MRDINKKRKFAYQKSFQKHGISPKALQWKDEKSRDVRYREMVADIDFEEKTVLDVGCGFGDIIPKISAKTYSFEYTGVDIVNEFIAVASDANKNRNLNEQKIKVNFLVRDIFTNPFKNKFDVVISSGILNSLLKNKKSFKENILETLNYRKKLIKILWDHANEVLAFNMSGRHPQPANKEINKIYYADSLEILDFCFTLTNKIIYRHHYHKRDFTIILFR